VAAPKTEAIVAVVLALAAVPAAVEAATATARKDYNQQKAELNKQRALAYHRMVAQLLFMATRTRRDMQMAVTFLTVRVKSPGEDDWGILKRVQKYLN
jgi:hypothetical protein